jgi:hypothetical protein
LASNKFKTCSNFIFRPSIDNARRLVDDFPWQQRCRNLHVVPRAIEPQLLDRSYAVLHPVGVEVRDEVRAKLVAVARLATCRIARLTWLPLKRL